MHPPDDDLLQPTLTASDDAIGFDAPWTPNTLVFLAFFAGPVGGGWLMATNFRRLGMARRVTSTLVVFGGLTIVLAVVSGFLVSDGMSPTAKRGVRFGVQAVTVAVALYFARLQQPRFDLFTNSDGEPGRLFVPGLLALVIGTLAYGGVLIGASLLIRTLRGAA